MTRRDASRAWRDALGHDLVWVLAVGLISRAWVFALAWMFNGSFALGRSFDNLLCSWDCGWYLGIVEHGYQRQPIGHDEGDAANWAFFPLFPMLARLAVQVSGVGSLAAALLVVNLSFLAALFVLHAHVRRVEDAAVARLVVAMLAFSPFGLYFSAPYTESVYLLLMVAAMHCAHSGRWIAAGLCAAALSATRNLGVFIVLPLVLLGVAQFGWRRLATVAPGTERFFLGLALAPLGLFVFMFHLHHTVGDALAFKNVQVAWGGTIGNPLRTIGQALLHGGVYERYCAAMACLSLGASVFLFRRGWRAEALILLIGSLIPAMVRIQSAPRYALTLYPVYLALGLALRGSPRAQMLALAAMLPPSGFLVASWVAQKTYVI